MTKTLRKAELARRFAGMTPIGGKRLVPRLEAMVRLGVGHERWNLMVRAGAIDVVKIGQRVFVQSERLDRLIDHPELLTTMPPAPEKLSRQRH